MFVNSRGTKDHGEREGSGRERGILFPAVVEAEISICRPDLKLREGGVEGPNKLVVFEEHQGAERRIRKTEDHEGLALSWVFVLDFNLIMMGNLK